MIKYLENEQIFHISNNEVSYGIKILKNKHLGHLYFGSKISDHDLNHCYYELERECTSQYFEGDIEFSLEYIKQEYPGFTRGNFTTGAYKFLNEETSEFLFDSFEIKNKKDKFSPQAHSVNEVLNITLIDVIKKIKIILTYGIHEAIITRSVKFINESDVVYYIDKSMSLSLDLEFKNLDLITLNGSWARERSITREKINYGTRVIESLRGPSSNVHNPFLCLCDVNTSENHGSAYGFSLIYSGNFLGSIETNAYNISRISLGIHPNTTTWTLEPNCFFQTPEAILGYSKNGLNHLSQLFHDFINNNIINSRYKNMKIPVLVNNWEATYFDFTTEKIHSIIDEASLLGFDMFVLDDGWFSKRNDATSSLGDWFVNENKIKGGMKELVNYAKSKNLKFGLWFEPEMISKKSELFLKHPNYAVGNPKYDLLEGRNQLVLDFANPEVVDYIFDQMCLILDESEIEYVKWDMNRSIIDGYSNYLKNNQEFYHRYIMGVYSLYEKLLDRYSNLIIEGCASGGARFDLGILCFSPCIWTSDNTDPISRFHIQKGTSMLYPLRTMSNHVSCLVNHQTSRYTSLDVKKNIAFFGSLGYELDLTELDKSQKEIIKNQIILYKKYQDLIYSGKFFRIESDCFAFLVVKEDALLSITTGLYVPNSKLHCFKLPGLDGNYLIENEVYSSDYLENHGFVLKNFSKKDFDSHLIFLKKI